MKLSNWLEIVFIVIGLSLSAAILAEPVSPPSATLSQHTKLSTKIDLDEHLTKKSSVEKSFSAEKTGTSKSKFGIETELDIIAILFAGIGLAGFVVTKRY